MSRASAPRVDRQLEIRPPRLQRDRRMGVAAAVERRVHVEGAAGDDQPVDLVEIGLGESASCGSATGRPPAAAMAEK